MKSQWTFRTM